jgi:TIR domain
MRPMSNLANKATDPAWIFVSHASGDLNAVRQLRNYLENIGAAPLLFHLRALNNAEEFWPLIEKEIAARNFFLFCQSEASEKSEWVRREREAVERLSNDKAIKIGKVMLDNGNFDAEELDKFVARTKCFLSSRQEDRWIFEIVKAMLVQHGFQVFDVNEMTFGEPWAKSIEREIGFVAEHGFFVPIVTADYLSSHWCLEELSFAKERQARILPFVCGLDLLAYDTAAFQHVKAGNDIAAAARELAAQLLQWK